ncbi:hypothetical protein DL764_005138 [Monosporascus ibericus]|uniref:Alcohol dehydrogenase-like N-terminal domain-containing protein n=1 Tax=Monosporascus ibericus TaxID=155417 RepID=A0A4Q4TDL3_9PEZI|nr:hypothetical protein DL764_005138 [Monosporascus ibericus]
MVGTHNAAILPQKGGPLSVGERATPEPGPNTVLIEVKAVALNPVDYHQRDFGMPPVPIYPAVIGSDISGVVAKKYALAQPEGVVALPDALSFEEGAILPLAVITALTAWTTIGIPLDTKYTTQDRQAVLI